MRVGSGDSGVSGPRLRTAVLFAAAPRPGAKAAGASYVPRRKIAQGSPARRPRNTSQPGASSMTQRDDQQARSSHPTRAGDAWGGRLAPFMAGAAGIAALSFAYYVRSWPTLSIVRAICPTPFCDFVDYYYPMGEAVFRTGLPVKGFLYSPFVALLLAVCPLLGFNASLVLWGILQVLFVSLYVLLFHRLVAAALPVQLLFVALTLGSYPLLLNLIGGQVSVFIMVALLAMLVLYERGRHAVAAGPLAVAVSFKFYPVVFLASFAARRDARFLLFGVAACGAVLLVVPGLVLGGDHTLRFYGALFDAFRDSGWVAANPHSQFFPHVVLRLAGAVGNDVDGLRSFLIWVAAAVVAANMALLVLVRRTRQRNDDLWSFQLVCLTIPFILKTSWPHDFVFLPFTQAFLAWRLLEGERAAPATDAGAERPLANAWRPRAPAACSVATLALLLSVLFSNIVFYNLVGGFVRYGYLAFLFWADLLLLIASYVMLLPPALRGLGGVDVAQSRGPSVHRPDSPGTPD